MDKWEVANTVGTEDRVIHTTKSYDAEANMDSRDVHNEWILGLVVSASMLIVPAFVLLFTKDKSLFKEALWNLAIGRDIIMLSISTILSLLNIEIWVKSTKTKNIAVTTIIVVAVLHGAFSTMKYLGELSEDWTLLVVNFFVILMTAYIIYLGYKKG